MVGASTGLREGRHFAQHGVVRECHHLGLRCDTMSLEGCLKARSLGSEVSLKVTFCLIFKINTGKHAKDVAV